jgi:hypothetical protein
MTYSETKKKYSKILAILENISYSSDKKIVGINDDYDYTIIKSTITESKKTRHALIEGNADKIAKNIQDLANIATKYSAKSVFIAAHIDDIRDTTIEDIIDELTDNIKSIINFIMDEPAPAGASADPVVAPPAAPIPALSPAIPALSPAKPEPSSPKTTPAPTPTPEPAPISADGPSTNISDLLEVFKKTFQHGTTRLSVPDGLTPEDKELYLYSIYSFYADNKIYLKEYHKTVARLLFLLQLDSVPWDDLTLDLLGEIVQIDMSELFKYSGYLLTFEEYSRSSDHYYLKKKLTKFDYFNHFNERYDAINAIAKDKKEIKTHSAFIYNMILHNLNIVSHPIRAIIEKESYLFLELASLTDTKMLPTYDLQVAIFLYDFCSINSVEGFIDKHEIYSRILARQNEIDAVERNRRSTELRREREAKDIREAKEKADAAAKVVKEKEDAKEAELHTEHGATTINSIPDISAIDSTIASDPLEDMNVSLSESLVNTRDTHIETVGSRSREEQRARALAAATGVVYVPPPRDPNEPMPHEVIFPGTLYDYAEFDPEHDQAELIAARAHNQAILASPSNVVEEEVLGNKVLMSTKEIDTLQDIDLPYDEEIIDVENKLYEFHAPFPDESLAPRISEHDVFQDSNLGHDVMPETVILENDTSELPEVDVPDVINEDPTEDIETPNVDELQIQNYSLDTFIEEILADRGNVQAITAKYRTFGIIP